MGAILRIEHPVPDYDAWKHAFDADPIEAVLHEKWIAALLDWYYDPMYDHQLTTKRSRIVATGDVHAIRTFLKQSLHSD